MSESRKRPSPLLLLLCGVAGGALYLQAEGRLYVPQMPPRPAIAKPSLDQAPLVIDVAFPPLASFDEIVERPLFAETRSRPSPAAPSAEPPESDQFALLGVAISNTSRVAIMRQRSSGEVTQVKVGDRLGGWNVSEIGPKSVLLVNGARNKIVDLQDIAKGRRRAPQPGGAAPATGRLPQQPAPAVNGIPSPPPAAVQTKASAAR